MKLTLNNKIQLSLLFSTLLVFGVGFFSLYRSYVETQTYIAGGSVNTKIMNNVSMLQKHFGVFIQEWKNILIRGRDADEYAKHVKGMKDAVDFLNSKADELSQDLPESERSHVVEFKENLKVVAAKYEAIRTEFINERVFEPNKADQAVRGIDREVLNPIVKISQNIADQDKKSEDKMLADMKQSLWLSSLTSFGLFLFVFFVIRAVMQRSMRVLGNVATELTSAGEMVRQASQSVSLAAQSLSLSTAEAAASIEETTASTEEVSSMIKLNSENAGSAKDLSSKNEEQAKKGSSQVQQLVNAINEISKSSNRIAEITNVIDDIAFQTNLLALNAAVEAARAGEQGKGFAVVAEAVRSLAQRSASSAKEISDLIKDSVVKVKQGVDLAELSGVSLKEIVTSVEQVSQLNLQISTASVEQSTGLVNINKAIQELDKVTQQNATSAHTAASASEELSGQADLLKVLVSQLEGIIYGTSEGSYAHTLKPQPVENSSFQSSRKTFSHPAASKSVSSRGASSDDAKESFLPLKSASSNKSNIKSVESFDESA